MITVNSPIVGFVGGDFDWPPERKRGADLADYFEELYRLCRLVNFDYRILVSQAWHETDGFTSRWWTERLNPAGIGITGDPAQNEASQVWGSGTSAARGHIAHMIAYTYQSLPWPKEAGPNGPNWTGDNGQTETYLGTQPLWLADQRFYHAVQEINGTAKVLGDLTGRWATDPKYGEKVAAKANQIFTEETPMTNIVFGNVPYPPVIQSHLPASNPMIKTSGAPAIPEAVVWHRMIGTFRGTDGWFHQGHAATAYGVAVAAIDAASDDGRIFEWIAPRSGWYGESSGPVSKPYGDGLALVNKVGINSVNRVSTAIEISGNYDTPLDEKARDAIAALTAYWADQKHIPWDEFPKVPGEDRSFVVWHQELTIGTGKVCPGEVVMNETPALIERTKAVLKKYQTATVPTSAFAVKKPIPGPVQSQEYGGKPFVRAVGSLTLAVETAPRQYASPTATITAKPYKTGRKISPAYATIGSDGEMWIVEKNGNRWPFSAFEEAA